MSVAALIERLTSKAAEVGQSFDELAIKAVEGAKVSEKEILEACQAAGVSPAAFAVRLELLQQRKSAWDTAYKGRDWDSEIAEAQKKASEAREQVDALTTEIEELRKQLNQATEAHHAVSGGPSRIALQRQAAVEEAERVLAETGNRDDWRKVQ